MNDTDADTHTDTSK